MWYNFPEQYVAQFLTATFEKQEICNDILKDVEKGKNLSTCLYRPLKTPNQRCLEPSSTDYGYCKKHHKTVQANNAKVKFSVITELLKNESTKVKEVIAEPVIVESAKKVKPLPQKIKKVVEQKEESEGETSDHSEAEEEEEVVQKPKVKTSSKSKPVKQAVKEVPKKVAQKKAAPVVQESPPQSESEEEEVQKPLPRKRVVQASPRKPSPKKQPLKKVEVTKPVQSDDDDDDESENEKSESDHESGAESEEEREVVAPPQKEKKVAKVARNKWGHFEHPETKIVFDPKTREAYGVQHKNGDVYSLGPDEIRICVRNGWKYVVPQTKIRYDTESSSDDNSSDEDSD